jgi:hypothetical protein
MDPEIGPSADTGGPERDLSELEFRASWCRASPYEVAGIRQTKPWQVHSFDVSLSHP